MDSYILYSINLGLHGLPQCRSARVEQRITRFLILRIGAVQLASYAGQNTARV